MSLHAYGVGRVTIREPSHILGCTLVRGIGYSWRCRCGAKGAIFDTWRQARDDAAQHAKLLAVQPVTADLSAGVEAVQFGEGVAGVTD
jgi:hypothetical protein